ncbi:hypothetical protein KW787_03115 [Candidatus Pacearchaeota archaeon]|nr:hypothetical protein [Candidatus Pacearchaeota archaeon]
MNEKDRSRKFTDYLENQCNILKEIEEKVNVRVKIAYKIAQKIESIMDSTDWDLRRGILQHEDYLKVEDEKRATFDVVDGTRSIDPVYRKLSKIQKLLRSEQRYHNDAPFVDREINEQIKIRMERREMKEEEYKHYLKNSILDLTNEFIEKYGAKTIPPLKVA